MIKKTIKPKIIFIYDLTLLLKRECPKSLIIEIGSVFKFIWSNGILV